MGGSGDLPRDQQVGRETVLLDVESVPHPGILVCLLTSVPQICQTLPSKWFPTQQKIEKKKN